MAGKRMAEQKAGSVTSLVIKLASIAVHAEELTDGVRFDQPHGGIEMGPPATVMDVDTIRSLLADPEVRSFLDDPAHQMYLPRKRSRDGSKR